MENIPYNAADALNAHWASLQEKDPLLHAAAESLYSHKGNPNSNPEPLVNTKYWRQHPAVDFSREAVSTLVNAMVSCDYAPANSLYAAKRHTEGGLKLLAEDKVLFHRLLRQHLRHDLLDHAQEIVLLKEYEDILKHRPNDLSPTLSAQRSEIREGMEKRCTALAAAIGPAIERCNVRAFPAPPSPTSRSKSVPPPEVEVCNASLGPLEAALLGLVSRIFRTDRHNH